MIPMKNIQSLVQHLDKLNAEIKIESDQAKLALLHQQRDEVEIQANAFEAKLYEKHS
jgi:hypothetical protein